MSKNKPYPQDKKPSTKSKDGPTEADKAITKYYAELALKRLMNMKYYV